MTNDRRLRAIFLGYGVCLLALVLLGACASPTPVVVEQVTVQVVTPALPEGALLYDACAYTVSYPPELATDDGILFEAAGEDVHVLVDARRRTEAEQGLALDELAARVGAEWAAASQADALAFERVQVTDYLGDRLDGLQADFPGQAGRRVRLMVVVRPETLLGDLVYDDVVYEVVAQAPETAWDEWAPRFDVLFGGFYPKSCGGV
jgi:hypothetical protein